MPDYRTRTIVYITSKTNGIFSHILSTVNLPSSRAASQFVLHQTLQIMQPLVRWLLRSGVGYGEFSTALKTVFLTETETELRRIGGKRTDSTRSMLSGLHRKDVRALMPAVSEGLAEGSPRADALNSRPSMASKLVTRWLADDLPEKLPTSGNAPSFESLARQVSVDVHPRAVLNELVRLGVVKEDEHSVHLCRSAFEPDPDQEELLRMVAASVADHLAAGVSNVSRERERSFLEQSVFADGLHPESVAKLETLAATIWPQVMRTLVKAATPLYEKDSQTGGDQRFRAGMFSYSAPTMAPAPTSRETAGKSA